MAAGDDELIADVKRIAGAFNARLRGEPRPRPGARSIEDESLEGTP